MHKDHQGEEMTAVGADALAALVQASEDGLVMLDLTQRLALWNRKIAALSGIAATDAIGKEARDIPFINRLMDQDCLRGALEGRPAIALDVRLASPSGGRRDMYDVAYTPHKDGGGAVQAVFLTVRRQPSPRGATVTDFGNHDQRFRIMADCSPVMLWIAGRDARCTYFNQPWLAFTGKTLEEEVGYGWAEGVHHEDFQLCVDTYMEAFNARREFSMEYRLRRGDGEFRWLLDTGRPYWNGDGVFAGFIGSCIDITALRRAREVEVERVRLKTQLAERERAANELAAANRELEAFSYSVSHDLRSPLRSVDGFIHALDEELGAEIPPEAKRCLDLVKDGAKEMGHLIDDLLRFSHLGQQSIHYQRVEPNRIVALTIEELRAKYGHRAGAVSVRPLSPCNADPSLLKHVFTNLLDNALKHTHRSPNAKIEVTCEDRGGDVLFSVVDNGDGFDMQFANKLFGVFQRLHRADEYEGTGVGLAIARRIVERHGGKIWADAALGRGASFFFTLPKGDGGVGDRIYDA